MSGREFLTLDALLLPPPAAAVVSLLLLTAVADLGARLARGLRRGIADFPDRAAGFVLVTALVGGLTHAAALAGFSSPGILRIPAWLLAGWGAGALCRWILHRSGSQGWRLLRESWPALTPAEKAAWGISVLIALALFVTALGPVSDADSLTYHIAVPLDWLRHGSAYPRPDWYSAPLAGLGEGISLLGLAAGSDGTGALFQWAGLGVAFAAASALCRSRAELAFAALLLCSCPVMLMLAIIQKPQLLPSASLALALALIVRREKTLESTTLLFAVGAAVFAISCKYSFIFSGGVTVALVTLAAYRAGRLRVALALLAALLLGLTAPIYLRNYFFYGNPLTPLMAGWWSGSDPSLMAYGQVMRNAGAAPSFSQWARFPWTLILPLSLVDLPRILGLGVIAGFWGALRSGGFPGRRWLTGAALLVTAGLICLWPVYSRFFLEPYLWCIPFAAALLAGPGGRFWRGALLLQGGLVLLLAVGEMAAYSPGALSAAARDRVMQTRTRGYSASRWLDTALPGDARVLPQLSALALIPRPFVVGDPVDFTRDPVAARRRMVRLVQEGRVTHLVNRFPRETAAVEEFSARCATPIGPPRVFQFVTRNPFRPPFDFQFIILQVGMETPGCRAWLADLSKAAAQPATSQLPVIATAQ